jgi:hypothetical protein
MAMTPAASSKEPATITRDRIRSANWNGSIPIVLSLAPTSLSSPTIPPPIHVLLGRHTYLHVGLQPAVMRLHQFSPPTFSFKGVVQEPDPGGDSSSDEEEEKEEKDQASNDNDNTVLEKSISNGDSKSSSASTPIILNKEAAKLKVKPPIDKESVTAYPICWLEDEATELPLQWHLFAGILWDGVSVHQENLLPWKIRLHFTSYPYSQILELDIDPATTTTTSTGVLGAVERTFKNSLKQALFLQHGRSQVAMNMTKQTHQQLWDSILTSKYSLYKQVTAELQPDQVLLVPIRLLYSSKPPLQKRCPANETLTLGELLYEWVPNYFIRNDDDENKAAVPKELTTSWRVAGIIPPLSSLVMDLWRNLCHPDHFLYIVLITQ